MIADQILDKMREVQNNLLGYLEDKVSINDCFKVISKSNQILYKYLFQVLNLIAQIANNHYRYNNFIHKIEKLILFLKQDIKRNYSNSDIFDIFKYNKRILLFLIEKEILTIDIYIVEKMTSDKLKEMFYQQYFLKEIKPFLSTLSIQLFYYVDNDYDKLINEFDDKLPDDFEKRRKIGQNEDYICQLIRNDSVDDFIQYVNQNNYSLESHIKPSIYETNMLLLIEKKRYNSTIVPDFERDIRPTLIQYAAFFGSIKIFKYLLLNNVQLTSSLWFYAVHSNNPELIHILEEKSATFDKTIYEKIFIESIKSHHNDIAEYLLCNYIQDDGKSNIEKSSKILKYYNFSYIKSDLLDGSNFYYLCTYNYFPIVDGLLKENKNIDVNQIKEYKTYEKKTPLFISIEKNNFEIVKALVSYEKTDVNIQCKIFADIDYNLQSEKKWDDWPKLNEYGEIIYILISPLLLAISQKNDKIIKLLLSNESIDINQMSMFYRYSNERYEFQEDNTRFEVNKNPLHFAIEKEYIDIVKILLQSKKIDVNSLKIYKTYGNNDEEYTNWLEITEQTPLHIAVIKKNVEIIKLLLNNNEIDVNILQTNEDGSISFNDLNKFIDSDYSIYSNTSENIDFLECKTRKMSELHLAILNENIEIIKLLLSNKKTDVNLRCEITDKNYFLEEHWKGKMDKETVEKKTPLQMAIEKNNIGIINLLLAQKMIDININSYFSSSHCKFSDRKCDGIDENDIEDEFTALHFTVSKGNIEIVKLLLAHKTININSKDKLGRKPIELTNDVYIKELFDKKD